jgi:protein SCO1
MKCLYTVCCSVLFVLIACSTLSAQLNQQKPENLQGVEVEEHLGEKIPGDLMFANAEGDSVSINDLLDEDKPVILNPVYYNCPQLCSMVMDEIYEGIEDLEWTPGEDYTIITFSINPDETPSLAAQTKGEYLDALGRPGAEEGWHFLTGKEHSIKALTEAVGFRYRKVERTGEYAHNASVMFLDPDGTIVRYIYGINYDEFNFRNALYEAADGNIGDSFDKVLLYCYQYDPDSNSYVPVAWRIMQIGGLATVLILGIFLGFLWLKERKPNNA